MMFVPRHHQPGYIEAIGCLNQQNRPGIPEPGRKFSISSPPTVPPRAANRPTHAPPRGWH
ncbi:MAG: hypothetical protein U0798_01975 [Gemmataceae bacterium]